MNAKKNSGAVSDKGKRVATERGQYCGSPRFLSLPTFLYIGSQKCGSTWIYDTMKEHPEIFMPDAKNLNFFNMHYERGIDWYASFFKTNRAAKALGEASHDYFLSDTTAKRIHQNLPDVKLICCLREPVERTVSAYLFYRKIDISRKTTLEEFLSRRDTIQYIDYYNNLLPYYRLFPKENILVLFFDEIKSVPADVAEKLYHFVGVDGDFKPTTLHRKIHPAVEPRSDRVAHLVYKAASFARERGFLNFLGRIKRNAALNRLLYKKVRDKPEAPAYLKTKLRKHFEQDYQKLSALIKRPLPEAWLSKD